MKKHKKPTADILGISFRIASAAIWILLVLAGGMFWNPSFRSWGVGLAGLGILMSLWLMSCFLRRENSVRGNAVQWVWLAVIVFLSCMQIVNQFIAPKFSWLSGPALNGTITISLIIQFTLIMLASMLAGEFLAEGQIARWLRESICCFMVLIYFSINLLVDLYDKGFIHSGLWFCGIAGVTLATANAFSPSSDTKKVIGFQMINYQHRAAVTAQLIVACAGFTGMLWLAEPDLFAIAVLVAAMVASLWWVAWRFGKRILNCWAILLSVSIIACGIIWNPNVTLTIFGQGERTFTQISSKGNGFGVMLGMIGLSGMSIFVGGLMWVSALAVKASQDRPLPEKIRSMFWLAGCWLSVFGLWSGGAFFSLTTSMTLGFAWGLLPAMTYMKIKIRPAWRFIAVFTLFAFWVNISNDLTLIQKVGVAFRRSDLFLHATAGFTLCLILVWWWKKRWYYAIAAIAAAIVAGAAGEEVQKLLSHRTPSWKDWGYHSIGVSIAAGIVLLVLLARYKRFDDSPGKASKKISTSWKILRITGSTGCLIAMASAVVILFNISIGAIEGAKLNDVDIMASDKLTAANRNGRVAFKSKFITGFASNIFYVYFPDHPRKIMKAAWNDTTKRNGICTASYAIGKSQPGITNVCASADPYSEVGYIRRKFKVQSVAQNQSMVFIDAYAAVDWLKHKPDMASLIEKLSPTHAPVILYGGTLAGYRETRNFVRKKLPDVPVVGFNSLDRWKLSTAASQAARDMRYRHHPVVILARNPLAAWVMFRSFYQEETKVFIVGNEKLSKKFVESQKNWRFRRFTQNTRRFKTVEDALKAIEAK